MDKQINGRTKTLGVIGNPVEHTLSPIIHNELAGIYGHNVVYLPYLVDGNLKDAIYGAHALHFAGLNVTVPHKIEVLQYVVEVDDFAKQIGAVNTLVPVKGGFKAYNTDIPGLYRGMLSDGVNMTQEEIIILGAGGVVRSVAMLALNKGAKHVYILNRTVSKACDIAGEINALAGYEFVTAMGLDEYSSLAGKKYLCIQATSVGLYPKVNEAVMLDSDFYKMIHTGYDLIYNPYETKFMSVVKSHGGKAFNGLKMLLYQGIIAYELWNDISVSEEVAQQILDKMREALGL